MDTETKTTIELENEIKEATDIEDYLQINKKHLLEESFCRYLNSLLSAKGILKADVVRESLLDRAYVYQIFSGERTPSRDKLIALAFGMHLTDAETQKMLKLPCNRELYARDERDVLILFALQHKQTIMDVNEALFQHGFHSLGAPT